MRRFSSYGPLDTEEHYYAPRKELIEQACNQLLGENPQKGGHYITVWAPRQCGKTWVMQEVVEKIRNANQFEIGITSMQRAKKEKNEKKVLDEFDALLEEFIDDFASIFRDIYLSRTNEKNKSSRDKTYLLHGLALVV